MVNALSTQPVSPSQTSQSTITPHSQLSDALLPSNRKKPSDPHHTPDVFHFESSDDDVPLLRTIHTQHASPSVHAVTENPAPTMTAHQTLPRRALRARKPEQQMPYTLDLMRHRDQFRRRGLKPVQNPFQQHRSREDDEQYQADEEEADMDKDKHYMLPKDIGDRVLKGPRLHENDSVEELDIHLRFGRKKFLAPDVPQKSNPMKQATPDREVSSPIPFVSNSRLLYTISVQMMT